MNQELIAEAVSPSAVATETPASCPFPEIPPLTLRRDPAPGSELMPIVPTPPRTQTDGIWIIDAEGRTVFANDFMAEILGTTAAELSGKDSFQYIFPEDLPAAQRLFSSKKAGSPAPFHFKLRRADGSSVWVDVQGTPLRNAAGAFTGIVGTFTISNVETW